MGYLVRENLIAPLIGRTARVRVRTAAALGIGMNYAIVDAAALMHDVDGELVIVARDPRPVERVISENRLGIWKDGAR